MLSINSDSSEIEGVLGMAWRQKLTEALADILRFAVRAAFLIDGIVLAVGSVYVVCKLAWFTVQFLDRWLFAEPW